MADIRLDGVTKCYPNGFEAVTEIDLEVNDGDFLVLVGPSGCGKSTLLRMIAGLEDITEGDLVIDDRIVNDESPKDRDIAMVFQNYALYPHMTVRKNIGYSLKLAKVPKPEINRRVEEAAALLELTDLLERKPGLLSGGQRQRVAMGRAIVRQPAAYLMDEPLSNLDAKLRVQMRAEIAKIQRDLGVTTIYVTHDQVEAMTMGTRVAVLKDGVLQQVANPQELYDRPINSFVAAFIGSPSMNLYKGRLDTADGSTTISFGSQSLPVPPEMLDANPELAQSSGRDVVIGIRPEAFSETVLNGESRPTVEVIVELIESLGSEVVVHTAIDAPAADIDDPDLVGAAPLPDDDGARCIVRLPPKTAPNIGEPLKLAVDTSDLQIFDASTGLTLRRDG
jgi:multiple sugar transport system ATP-binding protein